MIHMCFSLKKASFYLFFEPQRNAWMDLESERFRWEKSNWEKRGGFEQKVGGGVLQCCLFSLSSRLKDWKTFKCDGEEVLPPETHIHTCMTTTHTHSVPTPAAHITATAEHARQEG